MLCTILYTILYDILYTIIYTTLYYTMYYTTYYTIAAARWRLRPCTLSSRARSSTSPTGRTDDGCTNDTMHIDVRYIIMCIYVYTYVSLSLSLCIYIYT